MLPERSPQEAVRCYATFGGTPYYLAQVNLGETYEQNVVRLFFDPFGLLFEEPQMLLHQELNEPALYTSILDAIASGATRPRQISDRSGVAPSSVGRYPQTLESLGIVERRIPFGEKPIRSRKGLYRIRDPFHAFWYRFVSPYTGAIETASGEMTASQVAAGQALETCSRGNHPRDMDPLASNCPVHRKRRAVPWILMHGVSRTLVGFILPWDAIPVPSLQESFWLDPHQSRLPMVCPRAQVGDKCHDLVLGVAHAALEVD
jgi:hypothetical protein